MKQFSNSCSQQSHPYTSLCMTGKSRSWEWVDDWFTVVLLGLQADGCDSHVLWDSRGSWWRWQATHNVLFTVWVCSLSVTSECSLATAFITVFRGAANWKWNSGWALRQAGRDKSMWEMVVGNPWASLHLIRGSFSNCEKLKVHLEILYTWSLPAQRIMCIPVGLEKNLMENWLFSALCVAVCSWVTSGLLTPCGSLRSLPWDIIYFPLPVCTVIPLLWVIPWSLVGDHLECTSVCGHVHMEARVQSLMTFLRCYPPHLQVPSLTGLELTDLLR